MKNLIDLGDHGVCPTSHVQFQRGQCWAKGAGPGYRAAEPAASKRELSKQDEEMARGASAKCFKRPIDYCLYHFIRPSELGYRNHCLRCRGCFCNMAPLGCSRGMAMFVLEAYRFSSGTICTADLQRPESRAISSVNILLFYVERPFFCLSCLRSLWFEADDSVLK